MGWEGGMCTWEEGIQFPGVEVTEPLEVSSERQNQAFWKCSRHLTPDSYSRWKCFSHPVAVNCYAVPVPTCGMVSNLGASLKPVTACKVAFCCCCCCYENSHCEEIPRIVKKMDFCDCNILISIWPIINPASVSRGPFKADDILDIIFISILLSSNF